ncbi:MAG: helix-turn-helix domain-containing protein [Oscillospiraceae bacterium]|nr:helix-turn-helix domain-containing protein [Oscillospiraceae bacterium]MCL2279448.1 helix-turn-helix domain-containing protein [Oscillospiraceae bacterium]
MQTRVTDTKTLKKLMVDEGINDIASLSSATKINRNTLGSVLSGKSQPSAPVMEELIVALNIPPHKAGEIFLAATCVTRKLKVRTTADNRR